VTLVNFLHVVYRAHTHTQQAHRVQSSFVCANKVHEYIRTELDLHPKVWLLVLLNHQGDYQSSEESQSQTTMKIVSLS
jgi:hypothetical protein